MSDLPDIDLTRDKLRRDRIAHLWWARRGRGASLAVLFLANQPDTDPSTLQQVAENPTSVTGSPLDGLEVLDLCAGVGTVAAAAQLLGAQVVAVDNQPIPTLAGLVTLAYPYTYGAADAGTFGTAPDATWAGLSDELRHWASILIARARHAAGTVWLDDVAGLVRSRVLRCETCGHEAPAARTKPDGDVFTVVRAEATCPACGSVGRAWELRTPRFATRFTVPADPRADLIRGPRSDEVTEYPQDIGGRLDDIWVVGTGPLTFGDCLTPRQARLLRGFQDAFRFVRNELADSGYAPGHASALLTTLALGLSSMVDRLSTIARWDERTQTVRGLDRHEWTPSLEFCEMGGPVIERYLTGRFEDLERIVGGQHPGSRVDVRSDDMRSLTLGDARFDIVIWDPPYYDNIDYERVGLPFTRLLRSLVGDLHPHLPWPQDLPPNASRSRFDPDRYSRDLASTASEVARVLRPGGRLGVFWVAQGERTSDDLGELLEALQPNGLELIQSVALRTETAVRDMAVSRPVRRSVFLVFRRTPGARPADADAVLLGALDGRQVMYGGLVELLLEHLDTDELEDLIPLDFRGGIQERLLELVLSQAEPRDLLAGLSKKSLRTFVEEREGEDSGRGRSREELEDATFGLLGWKVPREPSFTVGSAIDDAEKMVSQLRLAASEEDIRGAATAAFDRIEQVLRFAVIAWTTWLRGEEWSSLLLEVVAREERLTFGQWLRAFVEVPKHVAQESQLLGQVSSRLRREKVPAALDAVVQARNSFAHPGSDQPDWLELRDGAAQAIDAAIKRLRAADEMGALPQVLQPLRETRDPYGRITLRLVGHRGHVEFLMTSPSDLSQPIVVLRGDTNPREVDPAALPVALVAERAGLT